jgi:oligopeptide/dipeptide ABC transporter ATP-binding protein
LENAGVPRGEREEQIIKALELVRLPEPVQFLDRYPHQLSGGQLQRVVMARALILQPEFVVADEPVSMLDVSVRAGVLNVFRDVRDRLGLTAIYISHDLALVRYVCERTIVMYLGRIMEDGPTEDIVQDPLHPYTKALVAAVPVPNPDQSHDPLPIGRGAPDPRNPPSGCVFRDRCPAAHERCASEVPQPRAVGSRLVACHLF